MGRYPPPPEPRRKPKEKKYVTKATVRRKTWDVDDYYHVIEVQVDNHLGNLQEGDVVKVTIEREEDYRG